jgi:hypothetical protein
MTPWRPRWTSVGAGLAMALAACGSTSGHTAATSPPMPRGLETSSITQASPTTASPDTGLVVLKGSLTVKGGITGTSGFAEHIADRFASCAALAANGVGSAPGAADTSPTFPLPASPDLKPSVTGAVVHYHGPGTYQTSDIVATLPDGTGEPAYDLSQGNTVATIGPDGSGSLTFSDTPADTSATQAPITGALTWTCSDS